MHIMMMLLGLLLGSHIGFTSAVAIGATAILGLATFGRRNRYTPDNVTEADYNSLTPRQQREIQEKVRQAEDGYLIGHPSDQEGANAEGAQRMREETARILNQEDTDEPRTFNQPRQAQAQQRDWKPLIIGGLVLMMLLSVVNLYFIFRGHDAEPTTAAKTSAITIHYQKAVMLEGDVTVNGTSVANGVTLGEINDTPASTKVNPNTPDNNAPATINPPPGNVAPPAQQNDKYFEDRLKGGN